MDPRILEGSSLYTRDGLTGEPVSTNVRPAEKCGDVGLKVLSGLNSWSRVSRVKLSRVKEPEDENAESLEPVLSSVGLVICET